MCGGSVGCVGRCLTYSRLNVKYSADTKSVMRKKQRRNED